MRLKEEIAEKRPQIKKKALFPQDIAPCHKPIATMAKLHELHFKLLPHPPYSPDLAPWDDWLFAHLKRMLRRKKCVSKEEMISKSEIYFETKDKSFYKKVVELLKGLWNLCVTLEEDYVDE